MPYLTLNGVTIPVRANESQTAREIIGETGRAFSGALRSTVRARKRNWSLRTPPVTPDLAAAIVGLVEGQGHAFSFDTDLYSTKGLPVHSSALAAITTSSPKFGDGCLGLDPNGYVTYATALGGEWTVGVWRDGGGGWTHWMVTSEGAVYQDGAPAGPAPSWLEVDVHGNVTIVDSLGALYDDLVCLPYVIPASWAAVWGTATEAFSPLPRLRLSGDIVRGLPTLVQGQIGSAPDVLAGLAGNTYRHGTELEITLTEA